MEGVEGFGICSGVVPVLVGPLQVLLTILPGILLALAGGFLALFKPSGLKNAIVLLWRQKVAVAGLIVVGVGVYAAAKTFWPRTTGLVGAAQQGVDWPTARGDLRRCGVVAGTPSPARAQLVWSYRQDSSEHFFASPAVVGNRVYVASAKIGAFEKSGMIYCFDADLGTVVWAKAPPDYRPTFSSPVVAGDYLVCGEGLHDTRDARVICLDLRKQGEIVWTFRTNNHVECTPVVADGKVFVGAGDDGLYCLDLRPGPDGQPKVHWHLPTEQYPDAETSLAVHDGKVYAGLGKEGAAIAVLDAATGKELRRLKMPYPVFSPASIADGKLYVGMGNGDYVAPGDGGQVICLDLKTLKTLWTYELPQSVLGAVAVKEDRLYFGCNDHHLYCLTRDGKLVQRFRAHAPIKTSPAVTDEHVFVVGELGLLFALDRHTLEPIWETRLSLASDEACISSPVVARGHVYVGTKYEGFLCVGKPASTKRAPRWAAPLGGPGLGGNRDGSPLPDAGEIHWLYPTLTEATQNSIGAPIAAWEDHLYVPRRGSTERGLDCLLVDKEDRKPTQRKWHLSTEQDVEQSPVVLGRLVACVDGKVGTDKRHLYFVDRESGGLHGKQSVAADASGLLTATSQQFLVQDGAESLSSFNMVGAHEWSNSVGRLVVPLAATDALIVGATKEQVFAIDRMTGAILWRSSLPHAPMAAPLLEKNKFLLATTDGLESRSLIDGRVLTSWAELGVPSGELVLKDAFVMFVNQAGEVVVLDRTTGQAVARVPGALSGQTPLVSRNRVIYAAEGRLLTFQLGKETPTPELWLDLSSPASLRAIAASPGGIAFVLANSRLYTRLPGNGLAGNGLACLGKPQ